MKRKQFLKGGIPMALGLAASPARLLGSELTSSHQHTDKHPILPPYLSVGDSIGITSPSGYITIDELQPAIQKLNEWGFKVKVGSTIGKRDFTFGGTDEERATDLQQLLDDESIKAILCARGGYGAIRIVDRLDFTRFCKQPKWIIGFSDITTLHCHIHQHTGIVSIHSKMCNSFPKDWSTAEPVQIESINSIREALTGSTMNYTVPVNAANRTGKATGMLVGGNLKTIESLAGSKSELHTKGKILFVEDTGEYLYSIDRSFWTLKRSGKLDHLAGLVIGGFKIKKDDSDAESFGKSLEAIVLEKVGDLQYPVCFDFPVGHQKNNMAIKHGAIHTLTVTSNSVTLTDQ